MDEGANMVKEGSVLAEKSAARGQIHCPLTEAES
jgi:hypothetical protein